MAKAQEMVKLIETALASNPGVVRITTDGQSVEWNREQALKELEYWQKQSLKASGTRPLFRGVDISTAW